MNIVIGVSNRHVHLTEATYKKLFGDEPLLKKVDLVQPGEFSSDKVLTVMTEKSSIENVRVLGPFRKYNQVEISRTDAYKLGVNPPIKKSGDLSDALAITVRNGDKILKLDNSLIIANRHIHISIEEAKKRNVSDGEETSVIVDTIKGGILTNIFYKVSENGVLEMHIDTDDANAMMLKTGDSVELLK